MPAVLCSVNPAVFDASVSTMVDYLIWVAVGDFLFSLFLVVILALPVLLDKSAKVQRVVVRKVRIGNSFFFFM